MATDLSQLAKRINEEHAACERALKDGLQHAVEAGKLLMGAKQTVEHGDWIAWVEANCNFSARSAQGYMRVSEKLLDAGNAQRVAHLSYREALTELATPQLPSPLTDQFHYMVETSPMPEQHKAELRLVKLGKTGIDKWPDDISREAWRSGLAILMMLGPEHDEKGCPQRPPHEVLCGIVMGTLPPDMPNWPWRSGRRRRATK